MKSQFIQQLTDDPTVIYQSRFENMHGEVFIYVLHTDDRAILCGDETDWQPIEISQSGGVADFILSQDEALWLAACHIVREFRTR